MVEFEARFVKVSQLGYLRRPELDGEHGYAWEMPNGTIWLVATSKEPVVARLQPLTQKQA